MTFLQKLPTPILLTILCLTIFTACDVSDSEQTGHLQVLMADAPGDFQEVWVDIKSIRVHQSSAAETVASESNEEAEERGWITIMEEPSRIDLLNLLNGNEISVGGAELEAGTYHQIRLILGEDNEVVIDNTTYDLATPSQQQSGTKLNINAEVEEDETYTLLVDFDVASSIVETGEDQYMLTPVLRAVNIAETGSISGMVSPSDFQTTVHAVSAIDTEDTLSTITTGGAFEIMGAAPGSYDVMFEPNSEQYQDKTLVDIPVVEGLDEEIGTITLQENN